MQKIIIPVLAMLAAGASAMAEESPLWLRNSAISPDGKTIAFTYKGDIFTVPVQGGNARQLTTSSAFDSYPMWSPDGTRIAFGSDREGSMDIYIMNATGGRPVRVTTHSGSEIPRAFLDNDHILYSSSVQPDADYSQGSFLGQTYVVDTKGGRPSLFVSFPMMAISVNARGNRVLYQDKKGLEDVLRKHERSSGTSDIWLLTLDGKDAKKGTFKQLTRFNGQDQRPVWDGDGNTFYYLSEEDGVSNVYRANVDGSGKTQLTKFDTNPVRHLSASADGRTLAFSQDGELYTLVPGQQPVKVPVTITTDDYARDVIKSNNSYGATSMSVSADGSVIAFILRGDVYVTSTKYKTTKRITDTPEQERVVDISPDGKTLVYDSERNGMWQLFTAKIKNPAEESLVYATEITEEPLYKTTVPAFQPSFSPDGKKVAFLENRTELKVMDLASKAVNTALDGKYNYSYSDGDVSFEWSPDSRWFLIDYIGTGGWNNKDIALVAADGSKVVDLTNSGYSDGNAKWVLDGKAMTWESDKNGYRSHGSWGAESDVFIMFFDSDAYDRFNMSQEEIELLDKAKSNSEKDKDAAKDKKGKKKDKKADKEEDKDEVKPLELDIDNAKYRVRRLTRNSSNLGDHYLSKKGDKLYYIASFEKGGDLWSIDLKEGDISLLSKGIGFGGFDTDKEGETLYFLGSTIKTIALPGGDIKNVEYEAPFNYKPMAERQYMYDHMWQQVKDKFYDENLHGVDWEKYRAEYQKFLPYINNNYDFAELLSEILGELNASHTGGRYYAPGAPMSTAVLGAFFDESYDGDGLLVKEVLKRGPLDSKSAGVAAGDRIMAIDGDSIKAGKDYFPLLEGKAGKKVRLTIAKTDGTTRDISIKPITLSANSDLLYNRWVERNRHIVDSVSGGKIGYVHVEGMDSPSYRKVYEEMLGLHRNCDAIIVDTRYNGGGWLHNDLAVLLSGKEYSRFTPRGQYIGSEPFSQWHKPSVMLVNEANYSDGYGAPYAYQSLKLGDIVGAPIPGTMTAVWWENQVDPSVIFGIPQVTNSDMNGVALENKQLNPDVVIYNTPSEVLNGGDSQLVGAVKHLMSKISDKK